MARPASKYPTELELQILKTLWLRSPLLAREVQSALAGEGRELAKTAENGLALKPRRKFLRIRRELDTLQPGVNEHRIAGISSLWNGIRLLRLTRHVMWGAHHCDDAAGTSTQHYKAAVILGGWLAMRSRE